MKKLIFTLFFALVLISPVFADLIREGETKSFSVNGKTYNLKLMVVSDKQEAVIFRLGNEVSNKLNEKEKHDFSDGSSIFVSNVYVDEAGDNADLVEYYFTYGGLVSEIETPGVNLDLAITNMFDNIFEEPANTPSGSVIKPACLDDSDCTDINPCTIDSCIGFPRKCTHTVIDGCPFNNQCLQIGTSISIENKSYFCESTSLWEVKKKEGFTCSSNYECKSGYCNSVCQLILKSVDETPTIVKPAPVTLLSRILGYFGFY